MSESILELEQTSRFDGETWIDRLARRAVRARLSAIEDAFITLIDDPLDEGRARSFGDPGASLRARVVVRCSRFYRALALRGAVGGAESYMDGDWWTDDLPALIRILARNHEVVAGLDSGLARLARLSLSGFHALRRNTRAGSRRNIAAHYDLGNDFYELFLDPTLTYSAGVFEHEGASMEEASVAKYERLCRKLALGPDDHVLEIGTGWGGFALHAARTTGCRVTTTTISKEQHARAVSRVAEAGLSDRIDVLFEDYRDLTGTYDKLVSIEMIEAVGAEHLETFFRVCGERLADDGVMALQAITVPDRRFASHTKSVDFIKRYIFPGGNLVSVGAVAGAASAASDLQTTHVEDITPHYAETLRCWRRRMTKNLGAMRELGYPDSFLRMWEFYLCYCEGGFDERAIGVVQVVLEKSGARRGSLLGRIEGGEAAQLIRDFAA